VIQADSKPTASMVPSVAIFLGGAAAVAIAALLLAPQVGRDSPKQLSEYGRRTAEMMWGWATAASDLFAAGEKVSEAALEARGKNAERTEAVKFRPQASELRFPIRQ
jgi:hypothetical protein